MLMIGLDTNTAQDNQVQCCAMLNKAVGHIVDTGSHVIGLSKHNCAGHYGWKVPAAVAPHAPY